MNENGHIILDKSNLQSQLFPLKVIKENGEVYLDKLPSETYIGDLDVANFGLTSFKNFPKVIQGHLIGQNNAFKNFDDFPREISQSIRIHSDDVGLEEFSFLVGCKFLRFYVSSPKSSVFKDDKLPAVLHDFKNIFLNRCEVTGDPYLTPQIIEEIYLKKVQAQ